MTLGVVITVVIGLLVMIALAVLIVLGLLPFALGVALMVLTVLAVVIVLGYSEKWGWTGVASARIGGEDVQPAKTLWDWLQLLVIPLALAGLAFLLNESQTTREQRREDERALRQRATAVDAARDEALRAYLTQMSGLMLDRKLLRSREGADVRAVARTVTLTTLRRLDGERKGLVVRFLAEARLLSASDPKVILDDADLERADLEEAILAEASLAGAHLAGAHLAGAHLEGADLLGANLRDARLEGALYDSDTTWPTPEFDFRRRGAVRRKLPRRVCGGCRR